MKQLPPRRSSLFLMELLIAILFFSLAAAICVRFFAQANQLSRDAQQLHMAVIQAQNMEEAMEGCDGDLQAVSQLFSHSTLLENELLLHYNENWELCEDTDASYLLTLHLSDADRIEGSIVISTQDTKEVLYQLPVKIKIPATFSIEG